jgi:hypothetical protein
MSFGLFELELALVFKAMRDEREQLAKRKTEMQRNEEKLKLKQEYLRNAENSQKPSPKMGQRGSR